ncbi:type I restriction-modification system subunit M [Archangium lansingense]|uniref:type I restriction-modification system subunit M n=1 Tax=Archangium lansingense TaxID=2995310 RepID=UPI003B7F4193
MLTRDRLNAHLWSAADILRGAIDSGDYKAFIFGFIFLKRLSDRFEEEVEELIRKGNDEEDAREDRDLHQFYVPENARWSALKKLTENIGEGLNKACAALEEDNPGLEGVLLTIDFNSEAKLGDGRQRDKVLGDLIAHFSQLPLNNANLSEPDMLGRAYEYLIGKFADDAGKKGGEFYTPQSVVELLVKLLDPQEGMRVCDPTCGSGGMLIQCAQHVADKTGKKMGSEAVNVTLHGQEKNLGTWTICKMNLLLHGLPDARVEKGDTIRQPKLASEDGLFLYDRVIANPPFSLDNWGAEEAKADKYNRFEHGLPPKNMGDYAFVQHMVATLNQQGMAAVVMPHGVLFREAGDGKIRRALVEADLFEAVIGLPENLFYGTGIPAVILVLNRAKPRVRKGKVLFIHAAEGFASRPTQNVLRAEDIERIVKAFRTYRDEERFARVVPLSELRENDFNLNISRYIDTLEPEQPVDLQAALADLKAAEAIERQSVERLHALIKELGYVA